MDPNIDVKPMRFLSGQGKDSELSERPIMMPRGPDGMPTRFSLVDRPSSSAPARIKVHLVGPMQFIYDGEVQSAPLLADEWRMEMS